MLRILFLTGSLPPLKCGVGDYTSLLAEKLSSLEGLEVGVLTSRGASESAAGPLVKVLPRIAKWNWLSLGSVVQAVKEWHPDIVHIQYPTAGYGRDIMPFWLSLFFGAMGIPVVQTWHEPLRWRSLYWYLPAALRRGGLVVVEPNFAELAAPWVRPFLARKICRFIPIGSSIPQVSLDDAERAAIKARFCSGRERLIVYFGFASPAKKVELLFDIADPMTDRVVLLCELIRDVPYQQMLMGMINSDEWRDRVTVTGFLPSDEVGRILAAADAVVFPFAEGVAFRNSSFHAARTQGTFVLTTSCSLRGYDQEENVYYSLPGNVGEMRAALISYAGHRVSRNSGIGEWERLASEHLKLYRELLSNGRRMRAS